MIRSITILFSILILFGQCKQNNSVELTDQIDPEIVLINIEEGDRAFISDLLLKVDSCNPILIAIDAWFINEKDSLQDSILIQALKIVPNDILAYTIDSIGMPLKSHKKFNSLASDEGLSVFQRVNKLADKITPIATIDNEIHELFPLKIIKHWKPKFNYDFKVNESIPIKFNRTLEQFVHFNGSQLKYEGYCKKLNNKVVLLGYLGPSDEDKHFTPIRFVKNYKDNKPDTYGLVIIANELRTILDYEK